MTPQEQLRHAIQQALEDVSGKITMSQGLEELTAALAIYVVAEGLDVEMVKKGLDIRCGQFQQLLMLGQVPADS